MGKMLKKNLKNAQKRMIDSSTNEDLVHCVFKVLFFYYSVVREREIGVK